MDEVTRNLISKWNMAHEKALRREEELRRHFSEAWTLSHSSTTRHQLQGFQQRVSKTASFIAESSAIASSCRKSVDIVSFAPKVSLYWILVK